MKGDFFMSSLQLKEQHRTYVSALKLENRACYRNKFYFPHMFAAHSVPLRVNLHARAHVIILFSHCFHVDQLVLVPHWEIFTPEIVITIKTLGMVPNNHMLCQKYEPAVLSSFEQKIISMLLLGKIYIFIQNKSKSKVRQFFWQLTFYQFYYYYYYYFYLILSSYFGYYNYNFTQIYS